MNRNVKIAKQLVKLAKSLLDDTNITATSKTKNVAYLPGDYNNFTGSIKYNASYRSCKHEAHVDVNAKVRNATFSIEKFFIFDDGIWEDGIWLDGLWEDGIGEGGTWKTGIWKGGTWKSGIWKGGIWKGGTWKGGTWEGGKDKNGNFHPAGDSPDKWWK